MKPRYLSRDDVPADTVANRRRIAGNTARDAQQALQSSKAASTGSSWTTSCSIRHRCRKNKKSVAQTLQDAGTTVYRFALIEVGQA